MILTVYMFCVSLLAVSLGVAVFAWIRPGGWAVVITVAAWVISNTGWFGSVGLVDSRSLDFRLFDPFSGVTTLTLRISGISRMDLPLLSWAMAAGIGYAALAGLLFLMALATTDPSSTLMRPRRGSTIPTTEH